MAHDAPVPLRRREGGKDSDGPKPPDARDVPDPVPHSAGVWNHWLGGREAPAADRETAERIRARRPDAARMARASRHFVIRALRHLAEEEGLRQFLDVGAGLPTVDNTHQVVQRADPACRVVYTDIDPVVLERARMYRGGSTPQGAVDCVEGDVRRPSEVLCAASGTLDLTRPVAVVLGWVLGHMPDDEEAARSVRGLTGPLLAGSRLVLCDGVTARTASQEPEEPGNPFSYRLRTPARIAALLGGLDPAPPGVVPVSQWRPEISPFGDGEPVDAWGGVARKR